MTAADGPEFVKAWSHESGMQARVRVTDPATGERIEVDLPLDEWNEIEREPDPVKRTIAVLNTRS